MPTAPSFGQVADQARLAKDFFGAEVDLEGVETGDLLAEGGLALDG